MAGGVGLPSLWRRLSRGALVLCYHNVVGGDDGTHRATRGDPVLHMPVQRFRLQMEWVRDRWTVVPLHELVSRLKTGRPVRRLASLTFDDAYNGFFVTALPILRALNLPSSVFVVAGAAESPRPFWWDHPEMVRRATPDRRRLWLESARGHAREVLETEQLAPAPVTDDRMPASWAVMRASMGADLEIGAHTVHHPYLPALEESEVRFELEDSARHIEAALAVRPTAVAYPYGASTSRVRDAAVAAGYASGLTLETRLVADGSDPAAIPRIAVPSQISDAAFEAWASGLTPPRS